MVRVVLMTLVLLGGVAPARAQLPSPPASPSEAAVTEARRHFVEGITWAQRERWEAALESFRASYAESGSPVALFNLAGALRELGRPREAREAFDRLLADPSLDDGLRARAEPLRLEVAAQVARVRIVGVPAGEARLRADGIERDTSVERPLELELDPGRRALAVELLARRWDWAGTVEPGARLELSARFPDPPSESLPWVVVGVGVAAVLAAVVVGVVVDRQAQLEPRTPWVIALP